MGTLRSNRITDVAGTASPIIPGAVLQVKQGILTTKWASSSSSTAFENTPLSVTITPQSTSSKILITGMINFSGESGNHVDFKVVRNGADILLSTETMGSRIKSHIHYYVASANDIYQIQTAPLNLLDEPSSTSALTYTLQAGTPYSAGYQAILNQVATDTDAAYNAYTVSTITAMEIGV
ncbi:MAG: hypothetical protein CMI75_08470 [Candidatus Pelagibacter sp.]|nr:hypothetical protein [Candidatus Pelagibacter sp.]|tara:strand:+ start:1853 stop:2392 length:540 start_codon:yes stop_codon:yes gene_type:complete